MTEQNIDYDPTLVDSVRSAVEELTPETRAGHGMDHIQRVLQLARLIQADEGGDRLTVELAALVHDLGDAKFNGGVERGVECAQQVLEHFSLPTQLVLHVTDIVDKISFRKDTNPSELSLEGKIVQDADRLDALGAIGVVRTIEYGATIGQPFMTSSARQNDFRGTGIGHFYEKLFKLSSLLNTASAKRIASERTKFMHDFVKTYLSECAFAEERSSHIAKPD